MDELIVDQVVSPPQAAGCCAPGEVPHLAPKKADDLAGLFKAVGHPVRVQMLDILSRHGGQVCVCDVESQFELSQPTISHHLKVLRQAGLVSADQRGQWIFYRVQAEAIDRLNSFLNGLA